MEQRVGFALIGASSMGWHHGRLLQRCPRARLVTLHGRDMQRASALASRLGVAWTTSYNELLENPAVDALLIATEPARHVELALRAIEAGKHVWIEKPLDVDMSSASRLLECAGRSPVTVSVVAPLRFDPVLRDIREKVAAGAIGKAVVSTVEMWYHRSLGYYHHGSGWRQDAGVLLNQAIHWLDMLIWMYGYPEDVSARLTTHHAGVACADTAAVCMRHVGGGYSILSASTACERSYPARLTVVGDRGRLTYDAESQRASLLWRLTSRLSGRSMSPLMQQLEDVIRSVTTGAPPAVGVRDAYDALRLVVACERAAADPART